MLTKKQIKKLLFSPFGKNHDFSPRGPFTPSNVSKTKKTTESDKSKETKKLEPHPTK